MKKSCRQNRNKEQKAGMSSSHHTHLIICGLSPTWNSLNSYLSWDWGIQSILFPASWGHLFSPNCSRSFQSYQLTLYTETMVPNEKTSPWNTHEQLHDLLIEGWARTGVCNFLKLLKPIWTSTFAGMLITWSAIHDPFSSMTLFYTVIP